MVKILEFFESQFASVTSTENLFTLREKHEKHEKQR